MFIAAMVTFFLTFRLLEVRGRLYELLTHCIPPDIVMKVRFPIVTLGARIICDFK